jgi:hypothetical protein
VYPDQVVLLASTSPAAHAGSGKRGGIVGLAVDAGTSILAGVGANPTPPAGTTVTAASPSSHLLGQDAGLAWSFDPHAYEHDMTVTAALTFADGTPVSEDQIVAAFVGDEVRGLTQPLYVPQLGQYRVFLVVHGESTVGEVVSLSVYDPTKRQVYDGGDLDFVSNAMVGAVLHPHRIEARNGATIEQGLPVVYALRPNVPNPFNPAATATTIRYALPKPERVILRVFDVRGRMIGKLVDMKQAPGWHEVSFEGRGIPSGIYFYQLQAGSYQEQRKMVVVR